MYKYKAFAQKGFPRQLLDSLQQSDNLKVCNDFINRELARLLLPYIEEKLTTKLLNIKRDPNYCSYMDFVTYRAEVYILTEKELEEIVQDRLKRDMYMKCYGSRRF